MLALALFAARNSPGWNFATYPRGGAGALASAPESPELDLSYDFGANETAADANGAFLFPGQPLAFALDVRGDGSGAGLRVAFTNRFGERHYCDLTEPVNHLANTPLIYRAALYRKGVGEVALSHCVASRSAVATSRSRVVSGRPLYLNLPVDCP